MGNYKPRLRTTDLWSGLENHVGSDRHASLLDKLGACLSYEDERVLQLYENGHTLQEISAVMSVSQETVQTRLRRIHVRANKPKSNPNH